MLYFICLVLCLHSFRWYLRNLSVSLCFRSSIIKYIPCRMFTFTIWNFLYLSFLSIFCSLSISTIFPSYPYRMVNCRQRTHHESNKHRYMPILHSHNGKYTNCRRWNKLITFPLALFVRVRLSFDSTLAPHTRHFLLVDLAYWHK